MATIVAQQSTADTPLVPTFAAVAPTGDLFTITGRDYCRFKNLGNQSSGVTIAAQNNCSQGFSHSAVLTVATTVTEEVGPFDRFRFADVSGFGHLTYTTAVLTPPAAPTLATAGSGGTVLAGVYQVEISYTNAQGETLGSASASITTTGTTSTITITSPAATGSGAGAATGWYAYVTQVGAGVWTRQQAAGSPTALGTNLVLTAPPTNTGAVPLVASTAAALFVAVVSS